jgi:hypothetical protein
MRYVFTDANLNTLTFHEVMQAWFLMSDSDKVSFVNLSEANQAAKVISTLGYTGVSLTTREIEAQRYLTGLNLR